MTGLDIAIVVVYFAAVIGVGAYASKKATTQENYLVAGQRLGYFVTFCCLSALTLGGASTVGTAALGFQYGISGFWLPAMLGVGLILTGLIMYPRIRKVKVYTVAGLLTRRYGHAAGVLTAVVSAIYTMMTCSVQIIAMGTILQGLAGLDAGISMVIVGAIVVLYTILGGMWAITLTDLIQFFFVAIGIVFIMLPICVDAVGGFTSLQASVPPEYFDLTNIGAARIIQYFLLYAFGMLVGQDLWQRFLTSRNEKVARRSGVAAGMFAVAYGLTTATIGMCAFVYFSTSGIQLDSPQLTFVTMANEVLPTGTLGLVLAAVLAVLMSTASGTLLASASLVTNDLVKPAVAYWREKNGHPAPDEAQADRRGLKASRVAVAVMGAVSISIAVALSDVLVALDITYAILSGALFFPIVLALFWKRATKRAATIAIVVSVITVLVGLAVMGSSALEPILIGLIVSAALMVGITLYDTRGAKPADGSMQE